MAAPEAGAGAATTRAALRPVAILLLLGTMWGGSFSLAKIATTAGVHPFGLMLWQAAGGAVIVLTFCALRRRLRSIRRAHLGFYAGCGLLGIVAPSAAIYFAASHAPAGVLSMLVTSVPIITYGLALAMRLETFNWLRVAGVALGFCAVMLIIGPRASLPAPGMAGWVLVAFIGPACYAGSNVFVARFRPPASDSSALAAGMLMSAAALVAPLALVTGTTHMVGPPWDAVDLAVLGLPVITGVAHIFLFELIHTTGPVFFSQVGYVVTVAGVLWGMLLFGERHSPWIWAALALMFAGLALVNLHRRAARLAGGGHSGSQNAESQNE